MILSLTDASNDCLESCFFFVKDAVIASVFGWKAGGARQWSGLTREKRMPLLGNDRNVHRYARIPPALTSSGFLPTVTPSALPIHQSKSWFSSKNEIAANQGLLS